jgi:hypothetical protein
MANRPGVLGFQQYWHPEELTGQLQVPAQRLRSTIQSEEVDVEP